MRGTWHSCEVKFSSENGVGSDQSSPRWRIRHKQAAVRNWSGVELLKRCHEKSFVTTLRGFVENGHDHAMEKIVSAPRWLSKPDNQPER
jgi:hypothetical protein